MRNLCHCWRWITICHKFAGGERWLGRQLVSQPNNKHVEIRQGHYYSHSHRSPKPIQLYRTTIYFWCVYIIKNCWYSSALSIRFEQLESTKQRRNIRLEPPYSNQRRNIRLEYLTATKYKPKSKNPAKKKANKKWCICIKIMSLFCEHISIKQIGWN